MHALQADWPTGKRFVIYSLFLSDGRVIFRFIRREWLPLVTIICWRRSINSSLLVVNVFFDLLYIIKIGLIFILRAI